MLDKKTVGVHGDREAAAFAVLPAISGSVRRTPLPPHPDAAAAALHEADLAAFGSALTDIQKVVGGHFAAAQGGSAWSSPAVGRVIERLGGAGAVGIGQSSWGPTGFAFVENHAAAARLYSTFVEEATAQGLEIRIVPRPQSRRDH